MKFRENRKFVIFIQVLVALIIGIIFGIIGLIGGMTYGGNYGFFEYSGLRGYESGGIFISIICFGLGIILGTYLSAELLSVKGSLISMLVFGIIGTALTLILNLFPIPPYLLLITLIFPILGSIIGFYLREIYNN